MCQRRITRPSSRRLAKYQCRKGLTAVCFRQVSCAHALQSSLYHFILTYHLFWSLVANCATTSPYWLCQQTTIASPPACAPAGQFVHSPPKRYTPFAVRVLKSPLKLSSGESLLHISSAAYHFFRALLIIHHTATASTTTTATSGQNSFSRACCHQPKGFSTGTGT